MEPDRTDVRARPPVHVGIIMDGNGRWATARGLPRQAGHQAGVETVRRVITACGEQGIWFVTLYTFSTENWQRPQAEVSALLRLFEEYATRELPDLQRNGVRVQLMGRRKGLPLSILCTLDGVSERTRDNDRLTLNLALNYGGRAEIVDAIRAILEVHQRGELDVTAVDEEILTHYLYCPGLPAADLIIRTAGEQRLSNFLLWRSVGAVFWSTPVLWPDFQREHLVQAIDFYRAQVVRRGD